MLILLPHSMGTHLTDGPSLPAPLLRQSPHSPCKAKRWVSQCKSATPVQSKLWVVIVVFTYTSSVIVIDTNENQPSLSTAHVHQHSPALAETQPTRLSQLCFVLSGLLLLSLSTCLCGASTILTMPLSVSDRTHRQGTAARSQIGFAFKPKQRQSRARTDFSVWNKMCIILWLLDSSQVPWLIFKKIFFFT